MSQSLTRLLCQIRLDPILALLLAGYAPALLLAFLTLEVGWIFFALLWTGLCTLLGRMAARGWPRRFAMPLTRNFYAVRSWGGRWSIFQRRPHGPCRADCKALLRSLAEEQRRLPAALPPGRYRALTHATVLRRLRAMETAVEVAAVPVYKLSLAGIRAQMTGGRCKHCKGRCPFPQDDGTARQFYLVSFRIRWAKHPA